MRHWQISNIICSVARLQNLAFIEVSPPPLYLCSWSAGFPIVRLKSSNDSAGTLLPTLLFISHSDFDSYSSQLLSSKWLISDLRKREVLLGSAINFWLRLAT